MKQQSHSRYETPDALRHDARTLAKDARALLEATETLTDEKIVEARKRLSQALQNGKEAYENLRDRIVVSAKDADRVIHDHPYPSMAAVFAAGTLFGLLCGRRHR